MPLNQFAQKNIFGPLGMRDTGFTPTASLKMRIAPTEKRRGQLSYLGDSAANAGSDGDLWLRGQVHDPTSYRMSGVAGHAGTVLYRKRPCDLLPDDFERRSISRRACVVACKRC
jgi:CubicO group peptidase (beta-lactamase class C family)